MAFHRLGKICDNFSIANVSHSLTLVRFASFHFSLAKKKSEKIEGKSWTRAKVAACKVLRFPMGEIPYPAKLAFLFVSQSPSSPD